ncbi:DNA methyltransferase, putative [Geotalea daltonii FRC-32]|uniref:DNA methyltransferase, putative n=1 Tax=Geotalea daltonii (strain DSM 22248 / JCM 15807 / FRC-32) TaxID=316067 RepID=B9M4U2_GEODF|nr:16S rRNA (guanine(966)-N(2))-methyltransferase RsmD [Geotalea daltonii]ACM21626.1 DNA methyltransferase, putative [Geotalea daltonii FRC-32]
MRIISGSAKGRKLASPKDMRVRPTADRVKESLFNILTNLMDDLSAVRTLDIFAGTGSLGIEMLSRGGAYAVFVDNHRQSAAMIAKNLQMLGFAEKSRLMVEEALVALRLLERQGDGFDLIFLDPPYSKGHTEKILEFLSHSLLATDDTIVVAEFSVQEDIPAGFGQLQQFDRRVYGDTVLAFLKKSS